MMRRAGFFVVAVIAAAPGFAAAQGQRPAPPPGLFGMGQGQNQNADAPVQIEAASLEVRDKSKMATFSGNVKVVQGDTTMRCQSLVVYYGQEVGIGGAGQPAPAPTAKPAPAGTSATSSSPALPQNAQSIRRIEALGNVTVLTKEQNASGDRAIYDLTTKSITLSGHVVITQGQNVMHGERVVVDLATGNARVESGDGQAGQSHGPVRAVILPNKSGQGGAGPGNFMSITPGSGPGSARTN
jgi:lipopolysaccharide export system protein LptA